MTFRCMFMTALVAALLVACAPQPSPRPVPGPMLPTATEIVAEVRAAGLIGAELAVAPFVDPHVKDLRLYAEAAEAAGQIEQALVELDKALQITPDAPDLLQWRAELILLRGEPAKAEALVQRSIALGPKSGPLCRRNWTLLRLLREARGEAENVASAQAMLERCTIAPPVRM